MGCSIAELRNKEIICKVNGMRIGNVDDVEIDVTNGKLQSVIIYGKGKLLPFFGRNDDIVIPWSEIDIIGEDTILINCEITANSGGKKTGLSPSANI